MISSDRIASSVAAREALDSLREHFGERIPVHAILEAGCFLIAMARSFEPRAADVDLEPFISEASAAGYAVLMREGKAT